LISQLFEVPEKSVGLRRLRATVLQATSSGDKLVAQRSVLVPMLREARAHRSDRCCGT